MPSITDSLNAWIPQVQGQYINMDWNSENKGFGAQCWDLAAHWSAFLGVPIINTGNYPPKYGRWPGWAGNMVDCFPQTAAIAAAYTLHGPDTVGQSGDIVVWGDSYWYYPATHVAVLVADKGGILQCMSQNSTPARTDNPFPEWTSGPTTIQSLPRQGLIGFIRPNIGGLSPQGTTITPLEEIDMAAEANIRARLDEIVAWQDNQFQEIRDTAERNRNALAGFVRDVVNAKESITPAQIDAKFAELTASSKADGKLLYKGTDSEDIYVHDDSKGLRHIGLDEYTVLITAGAHVTEIDQPLINRLLGK